MAEVKILIEGYAREVKNGWIASSTVTLIKTDGKEVIVDPGCNRNRLIATLKREGILTNNIDFVLLTHNHTDHTLLTGIFGKAKVLNPSELYDNDKQIEHNNKIPGTNLKIIQTPGHSPEHCSLVVPTKKGIYIVAGDTFWWTDREDQKIDIQKIDRAHPEEVNMRELIKSRKKILKIADYVIPGHGKMFKVKK